MNATLEEGRCDIVMGVPAKYDVVRTTTPYYRSTYVFVYPRGKPAIASLDDPALKKMKIGVHLLGADYTNPPPVHELSKRGLVDNVVGFSTFYSADNPPSAIVDAVASGRIDVAIVWGPAAGYYASRQRIPLELTPVPSGKGDLPFTFDISMGVKPGNDALRAKLEQILEKRRPDIRKILAEFHVPMVEAQTSAAQARPPAAAPARAAAAGSDTYQDVYNGWKWWHVYCYRCHGVDAVGTTMAPNIADPMRRLSPAAFLKIVRTGVPDKGMQAWDKLLDDRQIAQIHLYVRARADKVLPPGRPDEVGPNGGKWVPPDAWPRR
jgi:quinoprotein dehydrogenase-associated probable ABC transporter substrate-binding protein